MGFDEKQIKNEITGIGYEPINTTDGQNRFGTKNSVYYVLSINEVSFINLNEPGKLNLTELDAINELSISLWFNFYQRKQIDNVFSIILDNRFSYNQYNLLTGTSYKYGYQLQVNKEQKLVFIMGDGTSDCNEAYLNCVVESNEKIINDINDEDEKRKWLHIVVTKKDRQVFFYLNGIKLTSNRQLSSATIAYDSSVQTRFFGKTNSNLLGIGQYNKMSTDFANMSIDDFRFYHRALTQQEIDKIYKFRPLYQCEMYPPESTKCIGCKDGRALNGSGECLCPAGQYEDVLQGQILVNDGQHWKELPCLQCLPGCGTCTNGISCSSCRPSNPARIKSDQCKCPENYYSDNAINQCQDCLKGCKTCDNGSSCLSCKPSNPTRNITTCTCPDKYYDNGTDNCQNCLPGCQSCSNGTSCSGACKSSTPPRVGSECLCPDGYYNDSNNICQKCIGTCKKCDNGGECTECLDSDPARASKTCACPDKYFHKDGTSQCQQCQQGCATCSNDSSCDTCRPSTPKREIGNSCECPNGYFHNGNDGCEKCAAKCGKCSNNKDQCSECADLATRTTTSCTCKTGFYDDGSSAACLKCMNNCQQCNSVNVCDVCEPTTPQRVGSKCQCPEQYYDDGVLQCKPCKPGCLTCSSYKKCDSCKLSSPPRQIDNDCQCPKGYFDYNGNNQPQINGN